MELEKQEAKKIFAPLFENQHALPHDIFDFKNEMRPEITTHIKKAIILMRELMLSFLTDKVIDTVCYGEICSALHHANSTIHVAFIMDTSLPDKALAYIGANVDQRGFAVKIYHHKVRFHIFNKGTPLGANWSITNSKWNIEPNFQDFPYTLDEFLDIYPKINADFHRALDHLEKDVNGLYTEQSQKKIKKYFEDMEAKALKARYESAEKEYSLDWNLWRALNLFKVPQYYLGLVMKAECHALEGKKDGSKAV